MSVSSAVGELFLNENNIIELKSSHELNVARSNKNPSIILFYAHTCPHCVNFAPMYKHLSVDLKTKLPSLTVYSIDCVNQDCPDIKGYPTIKAFGAHWGSTGIVVPRKSVSEFIEGELQSDEFALVSEQSYKDMPFKHPSNYLKEGEVLIDFNKVTLTQHSTSSNIFPEIPSEPQRWPQTNNMNFFRRLQDVKYALGEIFSRFGTSMKKSDVLSELFVLSELSRSFPLKTLRTTLIGLRNSYAKFLISFMNKQMDSSNNNNNSKLNSNIAKFRSQLRKTVFNDIDLKLDSAINPTEIIPVRIFNPTSRQPELSQSTPVSQNDQKVLLVSSGTCINASSGDTRFPCSLWETMHMIAAHVNTPPVYSSSSSTSFDTKEENALLTPLRAQLLIRTLVNKFFLCTECKGHFLHIFDFVIEESSNNKGPKEEKPHEVWDQIDYKGLVLNRRHNSLIEFNSYYSTIVREGNSNEDLHELSSRLESILVSNGHTKKVDTENDDEDDIIGTVLYTSNDIELFVNLLNDHYSAYQQSFNLAVTDIIKLNNKKQNDNSNSSLHTNQIVNLMKSESVSVALWLWSVHNTVTRRLASDPFHLLNWLPDTNLPQPIPSDLNNNKLFIKYLSQDVRYPSKKLCHLCYYGSNEDSQQDLGKSPTLIDMEMVKHHAIRLNSNSDNNAVIFSGDGFDKLGIEQWFMNNEGFNLENVALFLNNEFRNSNVEFTIRKIFRLIGKMSDSVEIRISELLESGGNLNFQVTDKLDFSNWKTNVNNDQRSGSFIISLIVLIIFALFVMAYFLLGICIGFTNAKRLVCCINRTNHSISKSRRSSQPQVQGLKNVIGRPKYYPIRQEGIEEGRSGKPDNWSE